jgi:ABC-type Mn2+/Zn2+ transport system ATPase subunit
MKQSNPFTLNGYPALSVRGLAAGYPGARNAIDDVTFEVPRGQRIGVLGPNGAGKSTLFKAVVGLLPFTSGEISTHGEDCRTSHNLVGYVPQYGEIDLNFPVTVADVVMMGRLRQIGWFRLPGRRHWDVVNRLLDEAGLYHLRDRRISQLSGGQRQRVFIARALAQEADVLLLDEPFSSVDATAEQEIIDMLDHLREQGVTVLVATHDLNTAANRFDQVLLLRRTVIAYGEPSAVFTPENFREAYGSGVGIFGMTGDAFFVVDEHVH